MGNYINTNEVHKVWPITDYIMATIAGGAADAGYWLSVLRRVCRLRELQDNEYITVTVASKLLTSMLYYYKGYGISVGTIMGGRDIEGEKLYYVDNDGNRFEGDKFSCGSGSIFAYGVLDSEWKYELTFEQSVELA